MIEGRPSRTAWRVALYRGAHQILDVPLVLDDPLALRILGSKTEAALRAGPPTDLQRGRVPRIRAWVTVRSRVAEDALKEAVAGGVRQYVVLGAGLDTFAYRNPYTSMGLRVFELDYPATQAWKAEHVAAAGIEVPDMLTRVPIDFTRDSLEDTLVGAGFRRDQSAVFSWLGVAPYLSREDVMATLGAVARLAGPVGGIVFDYSVALSRLSVPARVARLIMAARIRWIGEPWRSSFHPDRLAADLRALGFRLVEDLGPETLNPRYFAGRTDGLAVGSFSRLMKAFH